MTLTGKARLAGVMGWPVSHSRSPRLHNFWLDRYGIDGAYVPLAVQPDYLPKALAALPKLGFRGVNVTIPHKEAAAAACKEVGLFARRVGAVNTITVSSDGHLVGSNSDGFGFLESLREAVGSCALSPAVVLGAGGASRAVVASLMEAGVHEIRLVNRTLDRAQALRDRLGKTIQPIAWDRLHEALDGAALLVNTTSLGMAGQPRFYLDLSSLPKTAVVADIVYVPLRTDLLAAAERRGNPTVDGLGMLIHQARLGFEAWFGVRPDMGAVQAARAVLLEDLMREQGAAA